ncbi:TPA: hypothetical protein ACWSD3_000619, partial [Escherichia coli]
FLFDPFWITILLCFYGVLTCKKSDLKIIYLRCGLFFDDLIFFQGVVWLLVLNKIKKGCVDKAVFIHHE